jgi:putative transposase
MATANLLRGAPPIHGELWKLGFKVSERTVSRLLPRRRRPPVPDVADVPHEPRGRHSVDRFLYRLDVTGRVLLVLVMSHPRRRIVHINISEHPTAMWVAQ